MAVSTYKADGTKATTAAKLDAAVFDVVPENHDLLKNVYTAYLSNGRTRNAVTKTRGLVSGGGKKPWKQKGTGRARFGSSRNPIWRGGGIAFGPTGEENYYKQVNVKAKRLAIRQALSLAAEASNVNVIETFECKDGKVAQTQKLLNKLGVKGKTLLVVSEKDDLVDRATRNIESLKVVQANYLNVYDVMNADTLIFSKKALTMLSEWLGTPVKATKQEEAAS